MTIPRAVSPFAASCPPHKMLDSPRREPESNTMLARASRPACSALRERNLRPSMQRRRHLAFCVSAFLLTTVLGPMLLAGAPAGKGIPDAKAQAKVEALLQELFKEDYAKAAQDPVARVRLANTFLTEGRETDDDRAGRYVLFREARDLAARAGDAPVAFQAIEDLAKDFGLTPSDVFQMKTNALMTASKAVASPDAYYTVVDSAL